MRLLCLLIASALMAQGPSKLMNPAALNEKAPEEYKVRVVTTKGEMVIAVHRSWAPLAADRFYNLVKNGFYDGCAIFRVMPGFAAQFGLNANPAIQSKWEKAMLKDEPVKQSNTLGHVSFAAAGADGRNTQVFINLKDNKSLDRQGFPPFGDVIKGVGVAALFYSGYNDKPNQELIVKQGNAYLKRSFPNLTYITKAVLE